jgi:hypothetical protein
MAADPRLKECSDMLWMLRYLLPSAAARPIMLHELLGGAGFKQAA